MVGEDAQREFGKRIQAARKRRGFSQRKLAEEIGKSAEAISHIEQGRASPKLETAFDIADVLKVDLTELFKGKPVSPATKAHAAAVEKIADLTAGCNQQTLDAIVQIVTAITTLDPGRQNGRERNS